MEPSTSGATKRPRQEDDNGKPVCNYLSCSVEKLIIDILAYFSYENNWSLENVERILIPKVLSYSETFKGGRVADFSKIKNASIQQARILLKIFRDCSEMILDNMMAPQFQLCYISNFRHLEKLTMTISETDNFRRTNDHLTMKKLKVLTVGKFSTSDPISQILNISPHLEKISFCEGTLSLKSMNLISKLEPRSIKLKNVKLGPSVKRSMLLHISKSSSLKSLKFILTESFFKNETFYALSYDFLRVYNTLHHNIENLTFTLCQYSEQKLEHLLNFPNLRTLKIYYSAQYNVKNFYNLINTLIQLNESVHISLIEYYIPPYRKDGHSPSYLHALTLQSARIKILLQESNIWNRLKIITCREYENQNDQNQ